MGLFKLIGKLFVPVKSEPEKPALAIDPDDVLGGSWETPPDVLALDSDIQKKEPVETKAVKKPPAMKKAAVAKKKAAK